MAVLKQIFPLLAAEIEKAQGESDELKIEIASSGAPTLVFKGLYVHSRRDPEREAERLVEAGITVLDDRGRAFTKENIRERRSLRDFVVGLAENGLDTERTASYGKKELNSFANSLDRELTRLLKAGDGLARTL